MRLILVLLLTLLLAGCAYNNCNIIKTTGSVAFVDWSYKGPSSQSQNVSPSTSLSYTPLPSGSLDLSSGTKEAPQAIATTPAEPIILRDGTVVNPIEQTRKGH
jgi:hypothetical protein